jgi:hypothetical protein
MSFGNVTGVVHLLTLNISIRNVVLMTVRRHTMADNKTTSKRNRKLRLKDLNPAIAAVMTLQSKTTAAEKRAKNLTVKKITEILLQMDHQKVNAIHKIVIDLAKA